MKADLKKKVIEYCENYGVDIFAISINHSSVASLSLLI